MVAIAAAQQCQSQNRLYFLAVAAVDEQALPALFIISLRLKPIQTSQAQYQGQ